MKYIILPIEDARVIFSEKEISTKRTSIDNLYVIVHEEELLRKRDSLGITFLPTNIGDTEWTYPVYDYGSSELEELLNSDNWIVNENT